MQIHAVVADVQKGNSKKTGMPYHMILCLAQNQDGNIGALKYFLQPQEVNSPLWAQVKLGSVVSLEIEERTSGFSSYARVLAALPDMEKVAHIEISTR